MGRLTEAEMDAKDEHLQLCIDRIYAGDVALRAVVAGEAIDPAVLTLAADTMAEMLADPLITGPAWTTDDIARIHQVRDLLTGGAPSPEARAVAASCRLVFVERAPSRAA